MTWQLENGFQSISKLVMFKSCQSMMFFYLKVMWEKRALNGSTLNQIEMFPIFEQDLISDSNRFAFFRSISLFRKCHLTTKLIWQVVSSLSGNQWCRGGTNTLLTKRPTQVLISITLTIQPCSALCMDIFSYWFDRRHSFSEKHDILWPLFRSKHCQRDNEPEGWVQLTKVTCLGHSKVWIKV